ncbi:MAG: AbrB/MazE/SpoVT family DNA-binding domain-containing protein [Bacteroidota bacterium]|nr:AbrB/MazE/SpoVT family DNA-binding domain-containing protein [Bacteroidota bacterium]
MDRRFEATFDEHGHFDMPADIRERHGFTNGAKVKIEEQGNKLVIEAAKSLSIEDIKKLTAREAIEMAVGFSGNDGRALEILLEERKRF